MTKSQVIGVLAAIALLVGFGFFLGRSTSSSQFGLTPTGAQHYSVESFLQGLTIGTRSQLTVSNTGALTTSGNVTVSTSNTATSTLTVGCVQMYATSTATAIHLEFSTTTSLATYSGGSAPNGGVSWRYGECPV